MAFRVRNSTPWPFSWIWMENCILHGAPRKTAGERDRNMHSIAWWPTVIVLAVATFTDLRSRRIPNWLVLPFMLAGVAVSAWLHGWTGVWQSLSGLALGAVLLGVLCWLGGMGMGDVKLCAAIGAWIGPMQLMFA